MTMSWAASTPDLAQGLFQGTERRRARSALGWLGAIMVHACLISLVPTNTVEARVELRPAVVEIVPPEIAPVREPEPHPEPTPAALDSQAIATHRMLHVAPAAARAGAALTAKADAPASQQAESPFDFTSDPSGSNYGGGVVAVGGKTSFGAKGAVLGGKSSTPSPSAFTSDAGEALVPLANLSRKPRLDEADPCRGYFPRNATDDGAQVSLRVVIDKTGKITSASLVSEIPVGQGFGAAAKSCLLSKRLAPALDREGKPAATATRINVHFVR